MYADVCVWMRGWEHHFVLFIFILFLFMYTYAEVYLLFYVFLCVQMSVFGCVGGNVFLFPLHFYFDLACVSVCV